MGDEAYEKRPRDFDITKLLKDIIKYEVELALPVHGKTWNKIPTLNPDPNNLK